MAGVYLRLTPSGRGRKVRDESGNLVFGRWWAKVKDWHGKWRDVPTEASTQKQAEEVRQRMMAEAEKQRVGLAPRIGDLKTFGDAYAFFWDKRGRKLRSTKGKTFFEQRLAPLTEVPLLEVTKGRINELLESLEEELAPESLNKLRARVHRVFEVLAEFDHWDAANPARKARHYKVAKRISKTLAFNEVDRAFAQLAPEWRGLYWTAVLLGLRKGELIALRKEHVNLEEGTILVAASGEHDTTKGNHDDALPIVPSLRPWLEDAMRSPGPFLFPRPDGTGRQICPTTRLDMKLRWALGRAGIVSGYAYKCRRKGCGWKDERPTQEEIRCPQCNYRIAGVGIPRHVRFHDLRHSTGTLLTKLGTPTRVVQRILRHASIEMTTRYSHVDLEDMRKALESLPVATVMPAQVAVGAGAPEQFATLLLPDVSGPKADAVSASNLPADSAPYGIGARGFEPPTSCAQDGEIRVSRAFTDVQIGVNASAAPSADFMPGHQVARPATEFATLLLPANAGSAGNSAYLDRAGSRSLRAAPFLRRIDGGAENLLSVARVAERLGVKPVSVYRLVQDGELPHVRVRHGAIRIAPADLEAFIARMKK